MSRDTKDVNLRIRARDESGSTLDKLEERLADLEKVQQSQQEAAKKGAVSARELDSSYERMAKTLKGLVSQHSLTKTFEAQGVALEEARRKTDGLRQAQAALVQRFTEAGPPTERQARSLATMAKRMEAAERQQQRATERLSITTQRLREAGIATDQLGSAQSRISAALQRGNAALERQAAASDRAAASTGRHGRASATASASVAGLTSRLAGMAAAYLSVHRAAGLAGKATEDFSKREGLRNQLALSVGDDSAAINAEMQYLEQQAQRIGMAFDGAAAGYAKFAAAATMAGRTQQEVRFIWETFAEVGRVANLTADNLDGVYKALEQIVSKGTIQAEELRGQLGDRLFGAFQVAADSLRDTYPDLSKALKDGVVTSDQLVRIAARYRTIVADQLPAATGSLAAQQARLTNAAREFRLELADSGFADAYAEALEEITSYLRSEDGKEFARSVGDAFSAAADAVRFLARNVDEVSAALKVMVGLWAGMKLKAGIVAIRDGAAALRNMGAAAGTAQRGFVALQAGIAGWSIGTYLRNNFVEVRRFGIALVSGFQELGARVKAVWGISLEELPRIMRNAGAKLLNGLSWTLRQTLEMLKRGAEALGRTELAASLGRAIDRMTVAYEQQGDKVREIKDQLAEDLAEIHDINAQLWAEAERRPFARTGASAGGQTAQPDFKAGKAAGASEAELSKRANLIDSLQRQLESLDASIERSTERTLAEQLRAIDTQYAKLARDIASLGANDPQAIAMAEELARLTGEKKLEVTRQYNKRLQDEHDSLLAKLEAADAAAGRRDRENLDARLSAITLSYASAFREIDEYQQRLTAMGLDTGVADAMRERLQLAVQDLQMLERRKVAQEELTRREDAFREVIAQRNAQIEAVRAQREAGQMGDADAARMANNIRAQYLPAIQEAAEATRQWALANATLFPTPEAQAAFIATIDAVAVKATAASEAFTELEAGIVSTFVQQGTAGAMELGKSLAGVVRSTNSWADALRTARDAAKEMFAEILQGIAQSILRQQALNAVLWISKALGWSGIGNAAIAAGAYHTGGLVGSSAVPQRMIPASWFAHAPRLHGGSLGLAANEYPAILKRNEEVLAENDPRNALNGGLSGGARMPDVRIVNALDTADLASAVGATREFETSVKNVIRAGRRELRTVLGI